MVDLGSGQGRSDFATAGVAALRRGLQKSDNAGLGRKMPFMDGHELIKRTNFLYANKSALPEEQTISVVGRSKIISS